MRKVISYSLWGTNPKYTIGAIRNAELANVIYPGWESVFFVADSVDRRILEDLSEIPNTEVINKSEKDSWANMFWRFSTCYNDQIIASIFRDTDSRLSYREKYAVDEWMKSNKTFHIMRDHPFHRFHILGGMWGYKHNPKYDIEKLLNNFKAQDNYGTDYQFLASKLYPLIKNDKIVHDEFFENRPFPFPRQGNEFVGDVFDENENRDPNFWKHI